MAWALGLCFFFISCCMVLIYPQNSNTRWGNPPRSLFHYGKEGDTSSSCIFFFVSCYMALIYPENSNSRGGNPPHSLF
jgi:hypothetical protein